MYFALITAEKLSGFEQKFATLSVAEISLHHGVRIIRLGVVPRGGLVFSGGIFKALFGLAGNPLTDNAFSLHFSQYLFFSRLRRCSAPPQPRRYEKNCRKTPLPLNCCCSPQRRRRFVVAVSFIVKGSYNPFIYFNF
jgi:alginate O-acetyltransferase complex protein AlgI